MSINKLIDHLILARQEDSFTALPAQVVKIDSKTNRLEVQPTVKPNKLGKYPVLSNVPIQSFGNAQWFIQHKIEPGDEGLLVFSKSAIGEWLHNGGLESVDNKAAPFSMDDALFIPGFNSQKNEPSVASEGLTIGDKDGKVFISLTKDGITIDGDKKITVKATNVEVDSQNVKIAGTDWKTHTHKAGGTLIGYNGFTITGKTGTI